jgi:hypothetical protein
VVTKAADLGGVVFVYHDDAISAGQLIQEPLVGRRRLIFACAGKAGRSVRYDYWILRVLFLTKMLVHPVVHKLLFHDVVVPFHASNGRSSVKVKEHRELTKEGGYMFTIFGQRNSTAWLD